MSRRNRKNPENRISLKNEFNAWQQKKEERTLGILNGLIYEYYCYDKIIHDNPHIHIIKAKTQIDKYKDGFTYRNFGSIYYRQNKIDLAEFDVLGFDDAGTLYWWEITSATTAISKVKDKLERKKELIAKLFKKVIFNVVIPGERVFLKNYPTVIIKEPKYELYYKEFFELKSDLSNCWSMDKLRDAAKTYDYFAEIILYSKKLFLHQITDYNSYLIERLYDLDSLNTNEIRYYNVRKKIYGTIIIDGKNKYKIEADKRTLIEPRKACNIEINIIRDRINKNKSK